MPWRMPFCGQRLRGRMAGTRCLPIRARRALRTLRPLWGRSCKLQFLWTVNLGAGLGAVSGAESAPRHSLTTAPANPVHDPNVRRFP
jgi:hypothetical protein